MLQPNLFATEPKAAVFSPCGHYRYTLWRRWDDALPYLQVIGLNPSTADLENDDPTIRRVIGFAKSWGFGALCMTNLFAWRDTKPEGMKRAADPVGPENDRWLREAAREAGCVLAAWGKHGSFMNRDTTGLYCLRTTALWCLDYNADGSPAHPLYMPSSSTRKPWPKPTSGAA